MDKDFRYGTMNRMLAELGLYEKIRYDRSRHISKWCKMSWGTAMKCIKKIYGTEQFLSAAALLSALANTDFNLVHYIKGPELYRILRPIMMTIPKGKR